MKDINVKMKKDTSAVNKSRRKSFLYLGTVALLGFSSILPSRIEENMLGKKNMLRDKFIFVNGWVLKKEDIYDS